MEYKKTALFSEHITLGAKMVPFAGYEMPVQYTGISAEHEAVRLRAGLFDVSHMGEFMVKGDGAESYLQSITSNDVSKLIDGKAQYSCLTNAEGGIIDDLLIYRIGQGVYMIVVNASNIEKDWNWMVKAKEEAGFQVTLQDISEKTSLLALQGPLATEILQKISTVDFNSLSYYTFTRGAIAGIENIIISATGYTGSGGYELYLDNAGAAVLWRSILDAGADLGLIPVGLGARDTLRLEMGYCLYGNDINDTTSPLEAGLAWITRLNKKFTASEILVAQKAAGITRKLSGFTMQGRGIPRHGYEIRNTVGETIGEVTSGTHSPSLGSGIGLGYVATPYDEPGTEIHIIIRDQPQPAIISTLPLYKK